jgi:hypothetical protein
VLAILTGHMAYVSMMMVDVYHNHPVLRTFVELIRQIELESGGSKVLNGIILKFEVCLMAYSVVAHRSMQVSYIFVSCLVCFVTVDN